MRYLEIMVAFAALGMVQTPDKRPASGDSKERATRPGDLLPDDPAFPFPRDSKRYKAAVAKGRAEAEAELNASKAKIWECGYNLSLFFESIDRETGLYRTSFGCVIDDDILGRIEGHNARIAEYIRDHGPPKNSFKPWEKELFGLKEYFEGRSRAEKPIRMKVGGPEARAPDGQFVVKLVKRPYKAPAELKIEPKELPCILVGEQDTQSNRIRVSFEDSELAWGPKGSWFAVLRYRNRSGDGVDWIAIDLRGMRTIREEFGEK